MCLFTRGLKSTHSKKFNHFLKNRDLICILNMIKQVHLLCTEHRHRGMGRPRVI